jgi:hypothetical protein
MNAMATKNPKVCMGKGIFKPVRYAISDVMVGNIGYILKRI